VREMFIVPRVQRVEFYQEVVERLKKRLKQMKDKLDRMQSEYQTYIASKQVFTIQSVGDIDNEIERVERFLESDDVDFSQDFKRVMSLTYFFSTLALGLVCTIAVGVAASLSDIITVSAATVFLVLFGGLHLFWIRTKQKINLLSYLLSLLTIVVSLALCMSDALEAFPVIIFILLSLWISSIRQRSRQKNRK